MKKLLCSLIGLLAFASIVQAADAPPVYELRIYHTMPGKLDALLARFRDHTRKLFAKHGMNDLAYWTPMDEKDGAGNTLVYIIAHKSREDAAAKWKEFGDDPEWKQVVAASEANGKLVEKIDAIFLTPLDFSPLLAAGGDAKSPRVFELRTYTTPDQAHLDALDARFRGGETELFVKAGMTRMVFTHPLDADKGAGHTLIYMLAHANRDAAAASWKSFRDDPAWVKMRADSEKPFGGSLTTKTQSEFLAPVDFSPLR